MNLPKSTTVEVTETKATDVGVRVHGSKKNFICHKHNVIIESHIKLENCTVYVLG